MKNEFRQVVRLIGPGELRAYIVYEHQLDAMKQGQPVALMLNFSLFFWGVAATGLGTIAALPDGQNKAYVTFLIISVISLIAGIVLFSLWLATRRPVSEIVDQIKKQLPPNPEAERVLAREVAPERGELHSSDDS